MGHREDSTIVCTIHVIVRMIKSTELRWADPVARMEDFLNFKRQIYRKQMICWKDYT